MRSWRSVSSIPCAANTNGKGSSPWRKKGCSRCWLNVFEPKLVARTGPRRRPIKVQVRRRAVLLTSDDGRQEVELVGVSLREVDVVMRRLSPIGTHVRLLVASGRDEWLRMGGRVLDPAASTNLAIISVRSATTLQCCETKES